MRHIDIDSFKKVLTTEGKNPDVDFINVCTPAEYADSHIEGVRNVPLDELEQHADEFVGKKAIYIHCRSGRRGMFAMEKLESLGVSADLVNVEGGLLAWEGAGYETRSR